MRSHAKAQSRKGFTELKGALVQNGRLFIKTIGNPLDAVLDEALTEVDQKPKFPICDAKISEELLGVNRVKGFDTFQFNDDFIFNDQVGTKTFIKTQPPPDDGNRNLSFHGKPGFSQLMGKNDFIHRFQESRAHFLMQVVSSINDYFGYFILGHVQKLMPLSLAVQPQPLRLCAFA